MTDFAVTRYLRAIYVKLLSLGLILRAVERIILWRVDDESLTGRPACYLGVTSDTFSLPDILCDPAGVSPGCLTEEPGFTLTDECSATIRPAG